MALRIDAGGQINLFTGAGEADARPARRRSRARLRRLPRSVAANRARAPGRGRDQSAHRAARLDRSARLARSRWRHALRDRTEGLHAGRRGSAQRQALDLRAHQSQPDPAAGRRRRFRGQLDRRGRAVVADRDRHAEARRQAHHRGGHPRRVAQGPDAGAARRRRAFRRQRAALRGAARRDRARRHAAIAGRARPCRRRLFRIARRSRQPHPHRRGAAQSALECGDAPAADAVRGAVRAEPGQLHGAARRAGGGRGALDARDPARPRGVRLR